MKSSHRWPSTNQHWTLKIEGSEELSPKSVVLCILLITLYRSSLDNRPSLHWAKRQKHKYGFSKTRRSQYFILRDVKSLRCKNGTNPLPPLKMLEIFEYLCTHFVTAKWRHDGNWRALRAQPLSWKDLDLPRRPSLHLPLDDWGCASTSGVNYKISASIMNLMLINMMMTKQDMIASYVHLHPIIYGVDVEFWWVKSNDRNVGASCQRIMICTNCELKQNMTRLLLFQKVESNGGPFFKVFPEC